MKEFTISKNDAGQRMDKFITKAIPKLPASLLYKYCKNRKGAILSLTIGSISLAVVGSLMNYFVLIPAFSKFYNMPLDSIVGLGSAVNPLVGDLKTLVAFAVAPFNLVKGILCSVLNLLLYKRLSGILHK